MKKAIGIASIAIFLFCACNKEVINNAPQVASESAPAMLASTNAAAIYKEQYTIDLSEGWIELNSCTGEFLDIVRGIWHVSVHATEIAGNRISVKFHNNTSNYKLVNLTTGVEYTGSYVSNDHFTFSLVNPDGVPFEESITLSVLLTTPGGGNNSMLKVTYHITFNANGMPTAAWFDNWRFGCQ